MPAQSTQPNLGRHSIALKHKPRKTIKIAAVTAGAQPQLTEVRQVNTAYGPAKIQERGSQQQQLFIKELPPNITLLPYIVDAHLCGAYLLGPRRVVHQDPGLLRFAIQDTIPFIMLDTVQRQQVFTALHKANIAFQVPEVIDLTEAIRGELQQATVLARNRDAAKFSLDALTESIASVTASPDFADIFLIKTTAGQRFVMAVGQLIESVIDLHPYFMKLNHASAICVGFRGANTWIAEVGRHL